MMTTTAMVFRVLAGMGTPASTSMATNGSEKLSAAKALPRKPDRVMAIWMVAKNWAGRLVRRARRTARLSPWETSWASLLSLMEIMAISAQAKMAFKAIRTICSSMGHKMGSSMVG